MESQAVEDYWSCTKEHGNASNQIFLSAQWVMTEAFSELIKRIREATPDEDQWETNTLVESTADTNEGTAQASESSTGPAEGASGLAENSASSAHGAGPTSTSSDLTLMD
jgi:hypothetical protein